MGVLTPVGNLLSVGAENISKYAVIGIVIIIAAIIGGIIFWISKYNKKKSQWTHKLRIKRMLVNGSLTPEIIYKMRRFTPEKGADIFELEKPLLGSYLIPQPGPYTGDNEFSIILDPSNRIYVNLGEKFNKATGDTEISMKHAGIDVTRQKMNDKWEKAHRTNEKITTAKLITYGILIIGIIALVIIGIVSINAWGKSQTDRAAAAASQAESLKTIAEASQTNQQIQNAIQLQLVPMLDALYGKANIAGEIQKYCPAPNSTLINQTGGS